jgi:hypothetical protein
LVVASTSTISIKQRKRMTIVLSGSSISSRIQNVSLTPVSLKTFSSEKEMVFIFAEKRKGNGLIVFSGLEIVFS